MPKFDVYVRMPTFVLDTDKLIEANVWAGAYWEKVFKGDIYLRWAFKELRPINEYPRDIVILESQEHAP